MRLSVDRGAHVYRYGGQVVPSVTDRIAAAGHIDSRYFTDASRRRGQYVHALAAMIDRRLITVEDVPADYRGFLGSYARAVSYYEMEWIAVEQPIVKTVRGVTGDDLAIAGRVDRVGYANLWRGERIPRSRSLCVADLKTGRPCDWHGIQLAAYDVLDSGLWSGRRDVTRIGIYLRPTGRADIRVYSDPRDYAAFAGYALPERTVTNHVDDPDNR